MRAILKPLAQPKGNPSPVSENDLENRKRWIRYETKKLTLLDQPQTVFKLEVIKAA